MLLVPVVMLNYKLQLTSKASDPDVWPCYIAPTCMTTLDDWVPHTIFTEVALQRVGTLHPQILHEMAMAYKILHRTALRT